MNVLALGLSRDTKGRAIVMASVSMHALFAAVVTADAAGAPGAEATAIAVSLAWFVASLGVWAAAFGQAVVRSTRGDDIAVASLFFLQGSAPRAVRVRLLAVAAIVAAITTATVASNPLGFLVNMLPIGFAGLWGARHGTFTERTDVRYTGRIDGRYRQRTHQGRGTR